MKGLIMAAVIVSAVSGMAFAADHSKKPNSIRVVVNKDGSVSWNGKVITCTELNRRFAAMAQVSGKPPTSVPCNPQGLKLQAPH